MSKHRTCENMSDIFFPPIDNTSQRPTGGGLWVSAGEIVPEPLWHSLIIMTFSMELQCRPDYTLEMTPPQAKKPEIKGGIIGSAAWEQNMGCDFWTF